MAQVSVIVPVYNVEAYLPRCLESIAAQTFSDFECILVDDGSSDSSGAVCDEQVRRDARFCVIHRPNRGVSSARNAGLCLATGDWIAFCDSDDELHPQTLELALAALASAKTSSTVIYWKSGPLVDTPPSLTSCVEPQSAGQLFSDGDFASVCSKLWNRQLLTSFSIRFNETMPWAEDMDFVVRYLLALEEHCGDISFLCIPYVLYFYNQQREGNTTTVYFPEKLSCEFQVLPLLLELFEILGYQNPVLLAPFCQHELFVLLSRFSDCVRFETAISYQARWCKVRGYLALPCMQKLLTISHSCQVWPALNFCARHGFLHLCLFGVRNCYKPWYTRLVRAKFFVQNKFYWGWQAIKGLFPIRKD